MSNETNTVMVCDACGKREVNPTRPYAHVWPEPEEWRHFKAGYRSSYPRFGKSEFDVCSWACAKLIHAKLAEVTFDRKTAENEAACLQWAVAQTTFKQAELDAKTTECANLLTRVHALQTQLKQFSAFDELNAAHNELIQRCFRLEEDLAHARKLDREELASILRCAIRVPRMLRRRPRSR